MTTHPATSSPYWRKSSHSASGPSANCVEVAVNGATIAVRDSTQATEDFKTLTTSPTDWAAFTISIKADQLD